MTFLQLHKISLSVASLLGVGAFIWWFLFYGLVTPSCITLNPQPTIVAFGDSLVVGYGASAEGGFVSLLAQQTGVPIVNIGKSGDTTAQAKARLAEVSETTPDITLVLLGGNDTLQRVSDKETETNLRDIITGIQNSGSRVILLGVVGGFPRDPYASIFERLADEYEVTYVPNVLSGVIGHSSLMSDGIHPNQAGYQIIADKILPVLEEECGDMKE